MGEFEMRALLYLIFVTAYVLADKSDNRRHKLPFVADAVGNSLPPPSKVPATVGSPVNLLTPDRYEFYTFDESGELVKKLMTLEEIQEIVAAGEESGEGLVTFANDDQPTIAFNFSQPPHIKVHSVVTNVQNVLKAQIEAHKNKPHFQPTFDTPDVSDSWSLILPSIFGNSNVDIVPDKTSSFTTPETETIDVDHHSDEDEIFLTKEGSNEIVSSSSNTLTNNDEDITEKNDFTVETKDASLSTISTTTAATVSISKTTPTTLITTIETTTTPKTTTISTTKKPTTLTTTTKKPSTTLKLRPNTTITTKKPSTTLKTKPNTATTSTKKPSTTLKPIPNTSTTTKRPSTTLKPRPNTTKRIQTKNTKKPNSTTVTENTTTTIKPTIMSTLRITTIKPDYSTKAAINNVSNYADNKINVHIRPNSNLGSNTEKNKVEYEKLSTFIPVSTIEYVTKNSTTTRNPTTTESSIIYASTTKRSITTTVNAQTTQKPTMGPSTTSIKPVFSTFSYLLSTSKDSEQEKFNFTTITTQSVSPSTTMSSNEFESAVNLQSIMENNSNPVVDFDDNKEPESIIPLFDVAQSFSQIASDLGSDYQPIPTTADLLDTTKVNVLNLENKENLELDLPPVTLNNTDIQISNATDSSIDNFVQISTLDPNDKNISKNTDRKEIIKIVENKTNITTQIAEKIEITTTPSDDTTIDPILSESMGDLLFQVVNEVPQSIIEENAKQDAKITTTQDTTTVDASIQDKKETFITTTETIVEPVVYKETYRPSINDNLKINNKTVNKEPDHIMETVPSSTTMIILTENSSTELPDSIGQNENERGDVNFVEISMISNKNESTDTSLEAFINPVKTEIRLDSINNITKKQENETNHILKETIIDKRESNKTNTLNNESATLTITTEIKTTTIRPLNENKFSSSKFNKINPANKINTNSKNDKVDKISELLPKIDDFRKKIQKVNIAEEELLNGRNNSWKLVPTLSPPKVNEVPKEKLKSENHYTPDNDDKEIVLEYSQENQGLEVTTRDLGEDIEQFTELCNELAFRYWNVMTENLDKRRSFVLSPYSITSMLAMMFMGARGATSGEMNEILKLDDMVTFNPHFTLKNISDSIDATTNSGIIVSAFIRELYSDRNKGKILTFYKERAQHFYNGHVEEINFKLISDIIRRRTNLLVKRYSWGKIAEYMKTNNIVMKPPLAAFSANIFQTDCTGTSVDGRDGEMYFVVSPNVRQRRLVPVPAVVYKSGFLAGYEPVLDATAAALGNTNSIVSILFLMPGQQGNVVHADDLEKLEQRLLDANPTTPTWNRLLRSLLPRTGLELQIPRFSHKSIFNVSSTLQKMGLKDIFDPNHADLGGLNGPSKDLFLSDMIQLTTFVTCGEEVVGEQHHIEEYPETLGVAQRRRSSRWVNDWDEPRDYQRAFHDPHDVGDAMHLPLHLRPRQARLPSRSAQPARLKYDRPFLYFVRHNPSGMILYFGRYNPRLLP